jgi:ABC-type transport system substrate-binding protein
LLEDSGWVLGEGERIRQQEGELLLLRLLFLDNPEQRALADSIVAQWAEAGIAAEPVPVAAAAYASALAEGQFDAALTEVRPPGDPDLYDFWSQEALVSGQNYARWNSRRASEALEQARQLWEVGERRPYYDAFLQYFNQAAPALTLFQHVYTYAVSDSVQNLEIGRIDHPRERYETLPEWFLLYRDVTVSCPGG